MKPVFPLICLSLFALMLTACDRDQRSTTPAAEVAPPAAPAAPVPVDERDALYQRAAAILFKARPVNASLYGVSEELMGGPYKHLQETYDPASEKALREALRGILHTLEQRPDADLNQQVMQSLVRYYAGAEDFDIGYIDVWMGHSPFIVNQINGPIIDVPNLLENNHSVTSTADAEAYLKRLEGFTALIDGVQAKLQQDAQHNWLPPKIIIDKTLAFVDGFTQASAAEHSLVQSFGKKLSALVEVEPAAAEALVQRATVLVNDRVYPAYRGLAEALRALRPTATDESGIWAQPGGEAFYRDAIVQLGDTDLDAEAIHALGLTEVERIVAEMDALLRGEGYAEGSVGERMLKLNDEARFLYADSDAGRQQLLDDLNGFVAEIEARMPEQFISTPPYSVEIRRIPVDRQDGAPGGQYTAPSLDGSQPGIYWINLRDIKANAKFDLKTLTYHEAVPGHHWQVALNMAQSELPLLRRIASFNAYVEGWALYSEWVAADMGLYSDDPYGDLGRLKAELFRAARLVVDTGLHHKKWSREQAIEYLSQTTGTVLSDATAEVERYMMWPGQALGYKLGMLKIQALRAEASKRLGESFDVRQFHDRVLLTGAVPMRLLESVIANWQPAP